MKRRNYTREILAQMAEGKIVVSSIGPASPVEYQPRGKYDPKPWSDGIYRYNGRYVHTVDPVASEVAEAAGHGETVRLHRALCGEA